MHLSITHAVTAQEKEELLTGLRAYNAQFLDLSTFSGDIGVYVRDDIGTMLGGLIGVRKGADYQEDIKKINIFHIIFVGIAACFALVIVLMLAAKWATS